MVLRLQEPHDLQGFRQVQNGIICNSYCAIHVLLALAEERCTFMIYPNVYIFIYMYIFIRRTPISFVLLRLAGALHACLQYLTRPPKKTKPKPHKPWPSSTCSQTRRSAGGSSLHGPHYRQLWETYYSTFVWGWTHPKEAHRASSWISYGYETCNQYFQRIVSCCVCVLCSVCVLWVVANKVYP